MKCIAVILSCFVLQVTGQLEWVLMAADNATEGPGKIRDCAIGYDKISNRLFVFGGKLGSKISDQTWYYDFNSTTWRQLKLTNAPQPRFTMAFGVWERYLYISTGEGPGKVFYNDVWRFDMNMTQWEILPQGTNPPEKRYGVAGGIYPGESMLWMTHGFAAIRYSNTFTYDLIQGRQQWVEEFTGTHSYNPKYPHARCIHGATPVTPNHLVIYGGCLGGGETGGPCPSSDSWLFSRVNKKWKRLEECFSPRMYPAMAPLPMGSKNSFRYRAVMYGGGQKRPIDDTDEFSVVWLDEAPEDEIGVFTLLMSDAGDDYPSTDWKRTRAVLADGTDRFPAWRVGHSMLSVDNGVMMFGGGEGGDEIWLLRGNVDSVDSNDLIGDGCSSKYWSLIHFHGLFMFLGWGLLLITGVFFARYFRHKDPLWFHLHRIFQVTGLLFTMGGFICGVMSVPFDHFQFAHGAIGLVVFLLGLLQALNGALRPHKREGEQSIVRKIWERFHRFLGRWTLVLAQVNISLGMFLAVVPTAVFAVWFGYLGVWVALFIFMEIWKRRKECGKSMNPVVSRENYAMNSKM